MFIVENHLKHVVRSISELEQDLTNKEKEIITLLRTEDEKQQYEDLCHSVITPLLKREKEISRRSRKFLYNKYKKALNVIERRRRMPKYSKTHQTSRKRPATPVIRSPNHSVSHNQHLSPSVNSSKHSKKSKSKSTHTGERSMSPLQEHTCTHKSPGKHVSRKRQHSNKPTRHHTSMSPLPLHTCISKSPSKLVSSNPKHSSRRTRHDEPSSASHITPKKH